MEFQGEFKPPAVAKIVAPIELKGAGKIVVTDAGIEVSGHKVRGLGPIMLLVFAVTLVLAGATSAKLDIDMRIPIGVAFLISFAVGATLRARQKLGERVSWTIPWSSIKDVKMEEGLALIIVRKFKPKGGLYFAPRGDARLLVDHLKQRLS